MEAEHPPTEAAAGDATSAAADSRDANHAPITKMTGTISVLRVSFTMVAVSPAGTE